MIEQLTAQQRKLAYLMGIVILMLPIIVLGMPAADEEGSGGKLARLRQEHDLGESTLGKVDPTSATMNLVLLGMRGVAVNLLRMQLDTERDQKQWAQMRATTESVILLQPHYIQVWRYLGWNLAYNVSAEWDAVEDRYFWVKEGAKFLMQGAERNRLDPEVYWDTGNTLGKKIGRSDEWKQFRVFFKEDPDKDRYQGGPDSAINPSKRDNYLVAKDWFQKANDAEEKHEQHIMMNTLFGHMRFHTGDCEIWVEAPSSEAAMEEIIKSSGKDRNFVEREIDFYQNVCNYRFWRTKTFAERQLMVTRMHGNLFDGEELFKKGDIDAAQEVLESGLTGFKTMLENFPDLTTDDLTLEEGLWGVLLWQKIYQLKNQVQPEEFPLKQLWEKEFNRVPNLQQDFSRKYGSS
ncbi:MAG: Uncharacterized protein FD138_2372 [Planctomycetota bacterium]|nr:MAG: Uncharacterized protein FD138_2372 [Planctomycetota bacterium]